MRGEEETGCERRFKSYLLYFIAPIGDFCMHYLSTHMYRSYMQTKRMPGQARRGAFSPERTYYHHTRKRVIYHEIPGTRFKNGLIR